MSLPNDAPRARCWVIDEIAPDFELLDVWTPPVMGSRDEFESFVEMVTSFDPAAADSAVVRALFTIRLRLGDLLGWDDATEKRHIPGTVETTLSARLPEELRGTAPAVDSVVGGFTPLYATGEEWAAEISNGTVHGVVHLAWVHLGGGRYGAEMRIYVKPRGAIGVAYLKLIQPFRHLIVYPSLMRQLGRAWTARTARGLAL